MATDEELRRTAAVALLALARQPGCDFPGQLAVVLCNVAAELGSSWHLTAGRPGSWEAASLQHLVTGTAGLADEYLAGYKLPGLPGS